MNPQFEVWAYGGCGARGPFGAGVTRALVDAGEAPDYMTGTSAGALTAAGISHVGLSATEDLWLGITSRSDVFGTQLNPLDPDFYLGKWNSKPLAKIIASVITPDTPAKIPYLVTVSDLQTMQMHYARSDSNPQCVLSNYVLASASIPVAVVPVAKRYVDGGCVDNAPLKPGIDEMPPEGGRITLILGSNLYPVYPSTWKPLTAIDVAVRALEIGFDTAVRNDVDCCMYQNQLPGKKPVTLRVIQPPADWRMGMLEFDPMQMYEAYQMGISAGKEALRV